MGTCSQFKYNPKTGKLERRMLDGKPQVREKEVDGKKVVEVDYGEYQI